MFTCLLGTPEPRVILEQRVDGLSVRDPLILLAGSFSAPKPLASLQLQLYFVQVFSFSLDARDLGRTGVESSREPDMTVPPHLPRTETAGRFKSSGSR